MMRRASLWRSVVSSTTASNAAAVRTSQWRATAAANRRKIVLAEPLDPRTLTAANGAIDFCDVTLVCSSSKERDKVVALASELGFASSVGRMEVVAADSHPQGAAFSAALAARRGAKSVPDVGLPLNFANILVAEGLADGHVSGAVYTSGDVVRSAVQIVGLRPDVSKVSSFFIMEPPGRDPLLFADCAVVVDPSAAELAEIADLAASNHRALFPDVEPRVALLSFSTKGSAESPSVHKVREALDLLRARSPSLACDGELQLDAALVPSVGAKKAPGSSVAGAANILIFPTLDAANIGYKLVERLAGAKAAGPVLQGLRRPCNDLSRGCSAEDLEGTILITALQAQAELCAK